MEQPVLIIDDDIDVRDIMKKLLELKGYSVVAATNGREGLALFQRFKPALVITDIIMPEQEGIETILELRKLKKDVRIIAVSGGGRIGNTDLLKLASQLGADDVLHKPFEPGELFAKVSAQLENAAKIVSFPGQDAAAKKT